MKANPMPSAKKPYILKPQDLVVVVKVLCMDGGPWSYRELASELRMGLSTVHEAIQSAAKARLIDRVTKQPIRSNLLEFLVHGVKYCYPAVRGAITRGVATSYAASPLVSKFAVGLEPVPVWPFPTGQVRGATLEPLHPCVPEAALADPKFAEFMALIDAIREGRPRESAAAIEELTARVKPT